ncbi:MAG: hypothetical protein PHE88_01030 [Elusimicrobia bacterium]|nr:hypothetical protein [Elusimicrobiota bacterium]
MKKIIIFVVLFLPAANKCAAEPDTLFNRIINQKKTNIDISELMPFYETLSVDEKSEQLRDWAMYGLDSQFYISSNKSADVLRDSIPMRYSYLKNKTKNDISPGRIKFVSDNDCVVIVQQDKAKDKSLIGSIIDRNTFQTNSIPKFVHIFEYSVDFSSNVLTVFYIQTVPGRQIYSQDYNYYEKEVKNIDDFKDFIEKIDNITKVQWEEKYIIFGGRKCNENNMSALFLEHIAALYQAYNMPISSEKERHYKNEYEYFINQKYNEIISSDKKIRKDLTTGKLTKSQLLSEIRKRIPYTDPSKGESNIGFSLDPGFNYIGMSEDLLKISQKDSQFINSQLINPQDTEFNVYIASNINNIVSIAKKIKEQSGLEPLLVMRRKLDGSGNPVERRFDDLLQHIEMRNSYQHARYDGMLQGTQTGMVLFYTDLTAKLMALNYDDAVSKSNVTGFRTMIDIKVPKLYWSDFMKMSQTRLWFGLRQENFEIYSNKLLFSPTATRVYAASSNPLFPGKETKPNFQSGEFLGWWDLHYSAIADYEPQYYKLDQIQKWGCIFTVLKVKNSHLLDFLFQVQVSRNLDFETWYKNTDYLKNKSNIPFIDKNKYNRKTECLELISSRNYMLMGQNFFLYGGVSLASRKDIIDKLSPKKEIKKHVEKSGLKVDKTTLNQAKPGLNYKSDNKNYGNFYAEKQKDGIKLKWNKGEDIILNDFIDALVSIQQKKAAGYKDESIFLSLANIEKVIQIEKWSKYLIKSKGIKNKWIYLNINRPDKTYDYPVKASGYEPDSDIFYARLLTEDQKDKLILNK